jgi:microcystin degradation protein MlrC
MTTKKIIEIVHNLAAVKPKDGFMFDEHGNMIRVDKIKDHDLLRDQLVRDMARDSAVLADEIQAVKNKFATRFEQHIDRMAALYQVKLGGKKGNVQLLTIDKKLKVERTKQDRLTTNEHMVVATQLVDQCLNGWSKGSNRNLQAFVRKYFRTDAKGNYNIADLQRVRKLKLETPDELWTKAMEALDNALEHDYTATYFRAFYREDDGRYVQIPLDISKA